MPSRQEILNAKILVVDDSPDNIELMEEILREEGYANVSSTMEPEQVCPLHREHNYDLILLDLQMPGLNGFQVMKSLKEIEKGGYLPVLALTAQPSFKIAALEAGARDFISKPFDLLEVHKRIHNMLEVRLLYKELAQYSRAQQELALHDALTGLPNRRLFLDRLAQDLKKAQGAGQRLGVLLLDLDRFKDINDSYGHAIGDSALVEARIEGIEATCGVIGDARDARSLPPVEIIPREGLPGCVREGRFDYMLDQGAVPAES